MFPFLPGLIAFAVALLSGFFAEIQENNTKIPKGIVRLICVTGIVISTYSIMNGIYHFLVTWEFIDFFGAAQDRNLQLSINRGIALLMIQFWPFAATIVGGAGAYIYWNILRTLKENH